MPDKPLQRRSSETIEVTFDPNRCAHAAECLRGAPQVFDLQARPWMQPEHLDAESLAEVIRRCPSGALAYHRLDGAPDETTDAEVSFRPQRNGPVFVRGNVEMVDAEGHAFATDRGSRSAAAVIRGTSRSAMVRTGRRVSARPDLSPGSTEAHPGSPPAVHFGWLTRRRASG